MNDLQKILDRYLPVLPPRGPDLSRETLSMQLDRARSDAYTLAKFLQARVHFILARYPDLCPTCGGSSWGLYAIDGRPRDHMNSRCCHECMTVYVPPKEKG